MHKIFEYSHLGGSEILQVRYPQINAEIDAVIESIRDVKRIKESKEKTMKGVMLYSPVDLNARVREPPDIGRLRIGGGAVENRSALGDAWRAGQIVELVPADAVAGGRIRRTEKRMVDRTNAGARVVDRDRVRGIEDAVAGLRRHEPRVRRVEPAVH